MTHERASVVSACSYSGEGQREKPMKPGTLWLPLEQGGTKWSGKTEGRLPEGGGEG